LAKAPTSIIPGSPNIAKVLRTTNTASLVGIRRQALVRVMANGRSVPFRGGPHATNRSGTTTHPPRFQGLEADPAIALLERRPLAVPFRAAWLIPSHRYRVGATSGEGLTAVPWWRACNTSACKVEADARVSIVGTSSCWLDEGRGQEWLAWGPSRVAAAQLRKALRPRSSVPRAAPA
jgi:hypothetical protein